MGILTFGLSTDAAAAKPRAATVTVTAAKAALPAAKELPGGVRLINKATISPTAVAITCDTEVGALQMPQAQSVHAVYADTAADTSPQRVLWNISVDVFAGPVQAQAATVKLIAAEKRCPKTGTSAMDGASITVARTLATNYAAGAWSGYRTISHLTATTTDSTLTERDFTFYLTRGNVIISVEEVGPLVPGNAARQDAWRKSVTTVVLARFDKLG